jgi:hypothetical protein
MVYKNEWINFPQVEKAKPITASGDIVINRYLYF